MKSVSVPIYSNTTGGQFIITSVLLSKRQPFLFTHPPHRIYNYPLSVLGPVSNLQYPGRHTHISPYVLAVSRFLGSRMSAGDLFSRHVPAGRILIIDGQIIEILQKADRLIACTEDRRKCVCLSVCVYLKSVCSHNSMSVKRRSEET